MDVSLRAFEPEDAALIHTWRRTPGMYELTAGNTEFYSEASGRLWVESKSLNASPNELYLAVLWDDQLVGYVSLNDIDHRNRRALWGGIVIGDAAARRAGVPAGALRLLFEHAFHELNLNRIEGRWLRQHRASVMLGKMAGFQEEGTLRSYVFKANAYHDVVVMSLLREDFLARNEGAQAES